MQLYTQLLQLRKERLKKIQACTGFELLTSAIPVQRFIAEVESSNPVQAWVFFRLSFRNCKSYVYNGDDHPSFNSSFRSSHMWFSYIQNLIYSLFHAIPRNLLDRLENSILNQVIGVRILDETLRVVFDMSPNDGDTSNVTPISHWRMSYSRDSTNGHLSLQGPLFYSSEIHPLLIFRG